MAGTIHRPDAEAQKLPPALRRVSKTDVGGAASFATLLEAANIQVDPKLRERPVVAADVADERQDDGAEKDCADVENAPAADEQSDQTDTADASGDEVVLSAAAASAALRMPVAAEKAPVADEKAPVADEAPKSAAPADTTDDNALQADGSQNGGELVADAVDAAAAPEFTLDPVELSADTGLPATPVGDAPDLSSFESTTLAATSATDAQSAAPANNSPTAIKTIDLSTQPVAPMTAAAPAQPISDLAAPVDPAAAPAADGSDSAVASTASKADAPAPAAQPNATTNAIAAAPVTVAPAATVAAATEGAAAGAVTATTSARGGQTGTQSQTTTQQGNQNAVAGTETARGERAAKNQAAQPPRFSKVLQERQADIARQVARAIGLRAAMRTDSKISLLLNPASLGALKINVSFDGAGKISVDAQTEQAATRHLLAGAAEELRTALRSVDIELSRFSVDQQSGGNAWLMNDAKSGFGADGRGQQGADGRTAIGDASARRRENETDELAEASGPLTMGGVDLSA